MRIGELPKKTCENKKAEIVLKSINFLIEKISFLREEIKRDYIDFQKEIIVYAKKRLSEKYAEIPKKKDYATEHREIIHFLYAESDHKLFFNIDTFMIDCRRAVEFSIRLLVILEDKSLPNKFGVENMLCAIENISEKSADFYRHVVSEFPEYSNFILSEKKWIDTLNNQRTNMIHFKIFNKTDEIQVRFIWDCNRKMSQKPTEEIDELTIFGRPILEIINYNLDKTKLFVEKTMSLREDLIKDSERI